MATASSAFSLTDPAVVVAAPSAIVWGVLGPLLQLRKSKRRRLFYSVSSIYCAGAVGILGFYGSMLGARMFGFRYFNADYPDTVLGICIVTCAAVATLSIAGLSLVRRGVDGYKGGDSPQMRT